MKKTVLLLAAVLVMVSCNDRDKKAPAIDPAFTGYISGFTSGVISTHSSLTIQLVTDVPEQVREGTDGRELFTFKPSLKGSPVWKDSRTVEFRPSEAMAPGTRYECSFQLHRVLAVPAELRTFEFQFRTILQSVQVEFGGLNSLDDEDMKWQQLQGSVITADHADEQHVEEILTATQNGRVLRIDWIHGAEGIRHEFTIDSIIRTEKKEEVRVEWDGKSIRSTDRGEETVSIPALGDFQLMNTRVVQQPDQMISLHFSDPVNTSQDLRGLIYLESGEQVRLERLGNQVKVYPAERLEGLRNLVVTGGIRNTLDYKLVQTYREEIRFASMHPDVELVGDGIILPGSDGMILPFRAVNLSAVEVRVVRIFENNILQFFQANQYDGSNELRRVGRMILHKEIPLATDRPVDPGTWNLFSLDLSELIDAEPGAIYNVSITFDRSHSLLPCAAEEEETELEPFEPEQVTEQFNDPPSDNYYYGYGYYQDYNWRERDDPCTDSYYIYRKNRNEYSRNVLASDLGIIAKGGAGTDLQVAVASLLSSEPLSGVEVEIYNYQNQLMETGLTNQDGMTSISLEHKPFLLVARNGAQRGYLRLDDGSALSTSMFDVGGNSQSRGLKGYMYGERGVWRPGDSIYMTFVLEDRNRILPSAHPVIFELFTPENQLYLNRRSLRGINGVYDFRTATREDAPTGNWLAKVTVGGTSFTKTVRIETVKPNRLKIRLDFGAEVLKDGRVAGTLHAGWLHGGVARNLKADVEMNLRLAGTTFEGYEDYVFDDPVKSFETEEAMVFDGRLDENGDARFSQVMSVGDEAPGMLQAFFKTRVFENSGDFSVDRYPVPYSPYERYVGVKIPEGPGWNGALYSTEPNLIPIVTLDAEGNPVDVSNLVIEIFEVNWRWWWDRNASDDLASYVRNQGRHLIRRDRISTENGKALYELIFNENQWGRRLIRISDPRGGHSTGTTFYVDYKGYWDTRTQEGPGGAEMLTFTVDRKEVNVGEEIVVNLPHFSEGRALVSLETGSRMLQTFWVESPVEEPLRIAATPEMAPTVYIHVTLVQPHHTTVNDRPIRMYGIQPVRVVDPATRLNPVLEMPDVLEPEKEVRLKVSEENGKAMTYTVAVVDDGLLDLTRFATPQPWNHFYSKEALGIRTWDLYKYVLGAMKGEMAGLLSVGGDEFIDQEEVQDNNRFPPVVKYLGPFELKEGRTNDHEFVMPNYVGSVRTMVVASHQGAYGSTEKTTPVKKPLMVLATLPRVVSPAEQVTLPVTVFVMEPGIDRVSVEVKTNDLFTLEGSSSRQITFEQEGDQLVNFSLEVARRTGRGEVEVEVRSGSHRASHRIDLQVRMPNPRITRTTHQVVEPGSEWTSEYLPVGLEGTNNGVIEVSVIPPLNLEKRLKFLMNYPHGCVEQTTSAVFPQLYLNGFVEMESEQQNTIQENITAGIARLHTFQTSPGGLTYWPGSETTVSEWGTSYAGHFMIEAERMGYSLPPGFMREWTRFQTRMANSWERQTGQSWSVRGNELNQAYRLYTLALAKKPAMGAMNRMREIGELSLPARWALAGAYVLAGRDRVAEQMVAQLGTSVENYRELGHTYGSSVRDQAIILDVVHRMGDAVLARKLMEELAEKLGSGNWYSTQTTAFALSAIGNFVRGTADTGQAGFSVNLNGKRDRVSPDKPVTLFDLPFEGAEGGTVTLENTGGRTLFVSLQLDGIPLDQEVADEQDDLGMWVRYLSMDGTEIDPSSLEQGTDFLAEVQVRHPGIRADYEEMALTQMFPAGWEIRNLRLDGVEAAFERDRPEYRDIRDDRVYTYFDLKKGETKTFVVMLNATYRGRFFLPAVYCEAMYDREIHATRAGRWIQIY